MEIKNKEQLTREIRALLVNFYTHTGITVDQINCEFVIQYTGIGVDRDKSGSSIISRIDIDFKMR